MKHHTKNVLIALGLLSTFSFYAETKVRVEISYGELVDKISILKIKSEKISDPEKLKNILTELTSLLKTLNDLVGNREDVKALLHELKAVNECLWDIEDAVRLKEKLQEFGNDFVELARNVYLTNDKRFTIKKKVDALLGSHISEEKSFDYL